MHIFITGGCGFIGSNLAEYHLTKGDEVHVIDNLSTGTLQNIASFKNHPAFRFDEADVLTWPDLGKTAQWADRVYHLAAIVGMFKAVSNPISLISNNIFSCRHLLHTISEIGAKPLIIIASSSSVYGDNPKHLLNEKDNLIIKPPTHPLATYTISKLSDEIIALAYYHESHLPIIVVRPFNTIGPRQTGRYGMVVPRFVKQACRKEPFSIFGDGRQTRSFCDVRDVIFALDLLANESQSIGQIINVGNDREISINDLALLICECIGYKNPSNYLSYKEAYGVEFTDITQRRPDLSKLHSLITFKHQWSLEQTIHNLISIYRNSGV